MDSVKSLGFQHLWNCVTSNYHTDKYFKILWEGVAVTKKKKKRWDTTRASIYGEGVLFSNPDSAVSPHPKVN